MGRQAKVPVEGNKLVKVNKIGTDAKTPYSPNDIRWEVMERLGFGDSLPEFADGSGGR